MRKSSAALVAASVMIWGARCAADTTNTLVSVTFGGGATDLNGTVADVFDAAITAAGGSATWIAKPATFKANGTILNDSATSAAYLQLGSYINNAKGTAEGRFLLTARLSKPTGSNWTTLGFFHNPTAVNGSFLQNPPAGLATVIYRPNGKLKPFGGLGNSNGGTEIDTTGTEQEIMIALDFTPAAGYNGNANKGKVSYYRYVAPSMVQIGPTLTYSSSTFSGIPNFAALGVSESSTAGTITQLTLKQIIPSAPVLQLMEMYYGGAQIPVGAVNDLGNTAVGGNNKERTYTILNNPGAGASLDLTGNPAVVFAESGTTSYDGFTISANVTGSATNLPVGASTTFTVLFSANQPAGRHHATVSIANTHAERNPFTFSVVAGTYDLATLPVLVTDAFGGGSEGLHGACVDSFSPLILATNGSPTWVAKTGVFMADGTITNGNQNTASVSLGSYVESEKGRPSGKFRLSATLEKPLGDNAKWVSVGFCGAATPSVDTIFINNGSYGTMLYRGNGEIDAYAGGAIGTDNNVQGSLGLSGPQVLTIELDLTPAGGYDGVTDFGTVTFFEGAAEPANSIGSYTYSTERSFRSLTLCTSAGPAQGKVSAVSLSMVPIPPPPPSGTVILLR